jgi:cyclopropane fatty-acyl-phospholipid synthase-like methyltransferase
MRRLDSILRFDHRYLKNPVWDVSQPPKELFDIINSGAIQPCRSLDLGCGRGHTVRYLQRKGFDAWGIDLSLISIHQAKKISESKGLAKNYLIRDVFRYVPKKKFDLLTDIGLYHLFPIKVRKLLADNVYRNYLEKGGRLLLWGKCKARGREWIPKKELLSFFSNNWRIEQISKTDLLGINKSDYYFLNAILEE